MKQNIDKDAIMAEIEKVSQYCEKIWPYEEIDEDIIAFAHYFFELGLAQKGE